MLTMAEGYLRRVGDQKRDCEKEIERMRDDWKTTNARKFQGGLCPTCGQTLPVECYQASVDAFEKDKRERLDWIVKQSKGYKERLRDCETAIQSRQEEIDSLSREISELKGKIVAAEKANRAAVVRDMEGFAEKAASLNKRIGQDIVDYADDFVLFGRISNLERAVKATTRWAKEKLGLEVKPGWRISRIASFAEEKAQKKARRKAAGNGRLALT